MKQVKQRTCSLSSWFKLNKELVGYTDVCDGCKIHHKYLLRWEDKMWCEFCSREYYENVYCKTKK